MFKNRKTYKVTFKVISIIEKEFEKSGNYAQFSKLVDINNNFYHIDDKFWNKNVKIDDIVSFSLVGLINKIASSEVEKIE